MVLSVAVCGFAHASARLALAQDCEVPTAAYDALGASDPKVALLLASLDLQYEGAERDGAEFAQARYRAAESAGYTYACQEGRFRLTAELETEVATGQSSGSETAGEGGETASTSTTVPSLQVTDLAAARAEPDDDHLDLWILTAVLIAVAGYGAVTIARSR